MLVEVRRLCRLAVRHCYGERRQCAWSWRATASVCLVLDSSSSNSSVLSSGQQQQLLAGLLTIQYCLSLCSLFLTTLWGNLDADGQCLARWPWCCPYIATLKAMKEKSNELEAAEPEPEPTTEVLFLCSYEGCGKTFIDAGALRKHSHIHGERQYVCNYEGCRKVATSRLLLIVMSYRKSYVNVL
ncbi:Zinc finger transcription factor YY1 [Camellia lanceoleosa]|uniref:Zinc finger transcription factor YY1 n=1 Tax=Camellia lanceoleosa TaxID=1840588 RepID=A0ACC0GVJ3_9ERIC|nr:Zinc finger transcription factor YY1 [Camellia lanceoleosa]